MSESGIIDVILFLGSTPHQISQKLALTFGFPQLPPLFSLGYHQSRWNYNDQQDVKQVNHNFDTHNIPVDVIWLDIEYTEGKKYFTFDKIKFSDPIAMQSDLASLSRKLVTIIDCHVKKEEGYFVYEEAKRLDFLVKTPSGTQFDGWCWPGSSVYPDFINPKVREWWSNMYSKDIFKGSTDIDYIWNDMNEPSVFSGPEITLPKDIIHHNNWENREIHNLYGIFFHLSTYEGLIKRSPNLRPFVLTRSFYLGSQKYAAVWTGDNAAEWNHLKASIPMVLSLGVSGIPFSGADVGGFFGNPSEELLIRWYQAGAFQPFFRAHSHIESKRREPWLFPTPTLNAIKDAIQLRYFFLPFWYTLFYFSHSTGVPVMRPMWFEFQKDESVFGIEDQYLLGESILVKPITSEGVTSTSLYFPINGKNDSSKWFDIYSYKSYSGGEVAVIDAPLTMIPVYQRSGSIIPKWNRIRRSTETMQNDPYTLEVCLDVSLEAGGYLYLDDGNTLNHQNGLFKLMHLRFIDYKITSRLVKGSESFKATETRRIERIIINGDTRKFTRAKIQAPDNLYDVDVLPHQSRPYSYVIRDPKVKADQPFVITLIK